MTHSLTPEVAARFAGIALGHVTREYPHKLDHVLTGPQDARGPRDLHPIFFGSFDWHSCVHGWWLLLRLRRLFPRMEPAARIEALAGDMLTVGNVEVERAYLDRPASGWSFSRAHSSARISAKAVLKWVPVPIG